MNVRNKKIFVCISVILLCSLYIYSKRSSHTGLINGDTVSLKLLLVGAIKAAVSGGTEVILVHNGIDFNIESKGKTKEGVNDPVTAADYRSHCAMYNSLIQAFPSINIISEEVSKDCNRVPIFESKDILNEVNHYRTGNDINVKVSDITIWIDPLDATKEFTENLLQYVTTMVCIAVKGVPVIGVIYKPFETERNFNLYWTWTGHGESSNLEKLKGASPMTESPILIVSRSHAGHVHNVSKSAFGEDVKIVSAAGAGYKFIEVASKRANAYVHMTAIKKWDICAGTAILSALGGNITSLFDDQPIMFGPKDPKVLESGLLATHHDHRWYQSKFTRNIE